MFPTMWHCPILSLETVAADPGTEKETPNTAQPQLSHHRAPPGRGPPGSAGRGRRGEGGGGEGEVAGGGLALLRGVRPRVEAGVQATVVDGVAAVRTNRHLARGGVTAPRFWPGADCGEFCGLSQ